jgi:hypothetical protein
MSEQDVNSLLGRPEEPPPSMLDAVIPVVALIGLIASPSTCSASTRPTVRCR